MDSILFTELKKLKDEALTDCLNFWQIPLEFIDKGAEEIYTQIKNKLQNNDLILRIETLEFEESALFALLLENEGSVKIETILLKKITSLDKIEALLQSLENKLLIFVRKSLTKLNQLGNKIIIFTEIFSYINKHPIFNKYNHIAQHFKKGFIYYDFSFMPKEWSKEYFKSFGFLPYKEVFNNKSSQEISIINKLISENYLYYAFYVDARINFVVCINHLKVKEIAIPIDDSALSYCGLEFFNILLDFIYYIKTNLIYLTNKGDFRKVDSENLLNIAKGEKKNLDIILLVLKNNNLIDSTSNLFRLKPEIETFLSKSLFEKYQILLFQNPINSLIFSLAAKVKLKSFTSVDIYLNYLKDKFKNDTNTISDIYNKDLLSYSEIEQIIEVLYYFGLISRGSTSDVYFFSISKLGFLIKSENRVESLFPLEKGGVVVNNDFSILVYDDKISEYDRFIIEIFTFKKNSDKNISLYNFDKKSILKAIYLGYNIKYFIDILNRNLLQPLDDTILSTLEDWSKQFKIVKYKTIKVLYGEPETIDILFHSKLFKSGNAERIGENYLLLDGTTQLSGKLTDEEIYVYEEHTIENGII